MTTAAGSRGRSRADVRYEEGVKGYAYDPARARKLLAEALGKQWQKAGFKPRVQVAEWDASFKRYLGKQFQDAYLLGLGGPMQDADELFNVVSSKGRGLYYKNGRVDALFDLWRGTMDTTKRRQVYRDLARAMVEDATRVFLLQQVDIYATRDRLSWTPRSDQWTALHEAALR